MRENFQITDKETGKTYWISRALAMVGCVYAMKGLKRYYLLERRGPGCPDFVGALAFPCGYLSWGETRKAGIVREIEEELGLDINEKWVKEWVTIDEPSRDPRENIVTRYTIQVSYEKLLEELKTLNLESEKRGGEKDEVSEVVLLSVDEIKNMGEKDFAFGHKNVILDLDKKLRYLSPVLWLRGKLRR